MSDIPSDWGYLSLKFVICSLIGDLTYLVVCQNSQEIRISEKENDSCFWHIYWNCADTQKRVTAKCCTEQCLPKSSNVLRTLIKVRNDLLLLDKAPASSAKASTYYFTCLSIHFQSLYLARCDFALFNQVKLKMKETRLFQWWGPPEVLGQWMC